MAKEIRRIRVWATRENRRHLEFSEEDQHAREAALAVVDRLQADDSVEAIDMEEYLRLPEGTDGESSGVAHGTRHWLRRAGHWREAPVPAHHA